MALQLGDEDLRGLLTRRIALDGRAPPGAELAAQLGLSEADVVAGLQRLAAANALVLHADGQRPWVVHPFALAPGSCWVRTPRRGYWANCLYCGLGIAAALRCDATVTTRLGGEEETVCYSVQDGCLMPTSDIFHLSTPFARWWDNVIFACSSFQPFRNRAAVSDWCARHDLPYGVVLEMEHLWRFASDWYGDYLQEPWRKRSLAQASQLFETHGLTGPFWSAT
ncbi:MAG TPA: organomercurial lyase [Myxococcaceae bacterium]|nr:organomercurial lyase [Myxococcaceae bacterium]